MRCAARCTRRFLPHHIPSLLLHAHLTHVYPSTCRHKRTHACSTWARTTTPLAPLPSPAPPPPPPPASPPHSTIQHSAALLAPRAQCTPYWHSPRPTYSRPIQVAHPARSNLPRRARALLLSTHHASAPSAGPPQRPASGSAVLTRRPR